MKLNFSHTPSANIILIGYRMKKKEKVVIYNSLIQSFRNPADAMKFEVEALNELRQDNSLTYESYMVSTNKPIEPTEEKIPKGKSYCPYCGQTNKLVTDKITGVEICPICHCSSNDYTFKNYNGLWNKKNKSKGE